VKNRRDARILALLVLYEADTALHPAGLVLQRHLQEQADINDEVRDYASGLVSGVVNNMDELNAVLGACAPEFPVQQIAPIDRNILRIALYEIKADLAPPRVAINEAIEISKEFGSESTPRFVNGVLGTAAARVLDSRGHSSAGPASRGLPDPGSGSEHAVESSAHEPNSQSENRDEK
jgi:N utilization substance protein B